MKNLFLGALALISLWACELPMTTQLNNPIDTKASSYTGGATFAVNALNLNGGGPTAAYTGVHAVFANTSATAATNVPYAVVLSDVATYGPSARKIYEGQTTLAANSTQPVDVTLAQIQGYLTGAGAANAPVDGNYYLGAVVNATSPAPTVLMAPTALWFVNYTFPQLVLQGHFVTTAQIVVNSAAGYVPLANGSYPLVVGAVPSNSPLISGTVSGSFPLDQIFAPGWKLYSGTVGSVTYYSSSTSTGTFNGGAPPSYLLGIPYPGSWLIVGALLVTPDGTFDIVTNAGPVEAVGLLASEFVSGGAPQAVTLTTSQTGQDLTVLVQALVTVGAQSGGTASSAGSVTFPLTKINLASNSTGSVNWYTDASGATSKNIPAGWTTSFNESATSGTLQINFSGVPMGTSLYYFKVNESSSSGGATSKVTTLTLTRTS